MIAPVMSASIVKSLMTTTGCPARLRENMEPERPNIVDNSLVARDKIILPPLHIKLGIMKQCEITR